MMKKSLLVLLCISLLQTTVSTVALPPVQNKKTGALLVTLPFFFRLYQKASKVDPDKDYVLNGREAFTLSNMWKVIDQLIIGQRFSPKAETIGDHKLQFESKDKPAAGLCGNVDAFFLTPIKRALPALTSLAVLMRAADGTLSFENFFMGKQSNN